MVVDTGFIAAIITVVLISGGLILLFVGTQQINIPEDQQIRQIILREHIVSCPIVDYNNYSAYNIGGDIRWIS